MSLQVEPTERFSNRVENYRLYRPGYPPEIIEFLRGELGLNQNSTVADVGSGTGIFTRLLLETGCAVFGVEPNPEMRAAGADYLVEFDKFKSVDGTAEDTKLLNDSVDFVTAAQAFHWFERAEFEKEAARVLKSGGYLALIWNIPQVDATAFMREYERFKTDFGTDYNHVKTLYSHSESADDDFHNFAERVFANRQRLDAAGLIGRALSSSYIPTEGDPRFAKVSDKLNRLFERHERDGKVEMLYDTRIYYRRF